MAESVSVENMQDDTSAQSTSEGMEGVITDSV